jgi:uncharacterized OB-fold protein
MSKQISMVEYLVLDPEPHLVANECKGCGATYWDRRNACAKCGKTEFAEREMSGDGELVSFSIVYRAAPNVPAPYVSSVIHLNGGASVKANLLDVDPEPEKIQLGTARNVVMAPEERRRTAYHEAGHAILGMLQPGADPVRKVSIVPRGQALGVTFQSPENDRYGYGAAYLRGRIIGALGGHAAEELVYGDVTTGA